jgi:hypothetical protein
MEFAKDKGIVLVMLTVLSPFFRIDTDFTPSFLPSFLPTTYIIFCKVRRDTFEGINNCCGGNMRRNLTYIWLDNGILVPLSWIAQTVLTMGLGALGALLGAIVLWKYWALPKISSWITNEGSSKLKGWLKKVVEDPDGAEAQQIGRLTGVAFSYALQGLDELASTKEGRERIKPLMEMLQEHIQQSIFATWGHLLAKLKEGGEGLPAMPGGSLPPEILGMAHKMFPGVDIGQMMGLMKFVSRFSGNGSDVVSASVLTSGPHSLQGEV